MHKTIPPTTPRPARRTDSWLLPAAATVLLHGGAFWMLYNSWSPEPPASAPPSVMVMQLVTLPPPTPELPEPVVEAEPPAPPEPPEPQIDQADIARKRLEEQQQREREEQQRLAEQQREQEQERQRQEAQARQEQQQREAEQRALAEQQRLAAEAEAQALADADAEAARRAAEAAIAQYQPISKKPPAYPRRALDRGLEGDCTVTYTVTEDGRVRDPEVVEGACDDPLFVRPSLAAAKSFRYQPRTVNGQRVAVADVHNTFRYRIQ